MILQIKTFVEHSLSLRKASKLVDDQVNEYLQYCNADLVHSVQSHITSVALTTEDILYTYTVIVVLRS
jgi:hypothetical protein